MAGWEYFIAYASPDRDTARALYGALSRRAVPAFFDERGIEPGADWGEAIMEALASATTILVLVSQHTAKAQYQRDEIARVCTPAMRTHKRVVPILLHDDAPLPYGLASKQSVRWTTAATVAEAVLGSGRTLSRFVVGPPLTDDNVFVGRDHLGSEVLEAVERGHGVQLLGERRMGKTSLLKWLQRHLPGTRRVAFVDAEGQETRDAWALLHAIAWQVGAADAARRLERSGRAALEALSELPETVLLLDEADRLVHRLDAFDEAFFGECRRLTQSGRLVWVTASQRELSAQFDQRGRTSPFLNDAVTKEVGSLEVGGLRTLLQGFDAPAVCWATEVSAGAPMVAQAIGQLLTQGGQPGDESLFDVVDAVSGQVFQRWRAERDPGEAAALLAWREGRQLGAAQLHAKRRLQRRGVWPTEGSAWAWWLRHG